MAISAKSKLFQPIQVGDMQLKHRVVHAPLTRFRVDDKHVPLPVVKEYYTQRASQPGTLLIAEATVIHPKAGGYSNAPGIWSDAQIGAWKEVTDCVHSKGSFIYLQLWALGRAAPLSQLHSEDPSYPYVSASDVPLKGTHEAPRPLTKTEIEEYEELFAHAAKNAVERAGFDGVEIHGANGYLIDQFIQDVSNHRTDEYGGSIENRSRFALEVLDAVVKAVGPRKAGIRLSPWSGFQDMGMQDPKPQFAHLVTEIKKAHQTLAYIHIIEPRIHGPQESLTEIPKGWNNDFIREIWTLSSGGNDTEDGRRLISAGNHDLESGTHFADEKGDLIAYGRQFISNPDLPYKLLHGIPFTPYDRSMFYVPGSEDPKGYTDYPFAEKPEPAA